LGHVKRTRITQILNLLLFAPNIREKILFLSPTLGCDPVPGPIANDSPAFLDWEQAKAPLCLARIGWNMLPGNIWKTARNRRKVTWSLTSARVVSPI
jgi:hypothetical protein